MEIEAVRPFWLEGNRVERGSVIDVDPILANTLRASGKAKQPEKRPRRQRRRKVDDQAQTAGDE